ncbi:MAG: hypothetical protein EPO22_06305 [Dehalococcoidia bacterium]|nr:MAG: hypothetical protein EPO22_06305 [Dehalococcoidia bacterium]
MRGTIIHMQATPAHHDGRWLFLALAAATLAFAFALRYPSLFEPRWYGDEGIFAGVATNIREGRTLYAQAWDNKPPLIFYTYAAAQSTLGSSVFALHLWATISVLATQATVIAVAAQLFGQRRALVAGALFALAMGTPVIEGNLALTETFMILPTSLGVLAFVLTERAPEGRRVAGYIASGAMFGVAAGFKQVAVFDLAAVMVMVLAMHERPRRALLALATGFVAPQLAWSALFVANGAFSEYWYAIAGSLRVYSEWAPYEGPFLRVAGYLPALMAIAWLVRRRQLGEEITLGALPVVWLGLAFSGATSSTFPFPHYLQQAAPACALVVASNPLRWERDGLSRALLGVAAVLVAAIIVGRFGPEFGVRKQVNPVRYYTTFVEHRWGTMSDQDYDYRFDGKVLAVNDIVAYTRQDGAGDSMFAWGELPWLYAAGGYTNPSRYYSSFLGELIPGARPNIMRDLEARPPVYIVVSDAAYSPFPELDAFIGGRYSLLRGQGDWRLFRLDGVDGRLAPAGATAGSGSGGER